MAPTALAPLPAVRAVRLGAQSKAAIAMASAIGLIAFALPLLAAPGSSAVAHADDAPLLFALVVPVLLIVVLAQVSDGGMDAPGSPFVLSDISVGRPRPGSRSLAGQVL